MPLRPATYSDLWPAAGVMAAAFRDNELLGEFMHPHRSLYPNDMQRHMFRDLRLKYFTGGPDDHILLGFAPGSPATILGLAHWQRWGRTPPLTGVIGRVYYAVVRVLVKAWNAVDAWIAPNRAADRSKLDVIARSERYVADYWTGTRAKVWNLAELGVDPKAQGMGVGKDLVEWGFERAREDGVGCTVISADGKEGFYKKCGFDVVAGKATEGEGNPLGSLPGGTIFFWDNGIEPVGVKKAGHIVAKK